MSRRIGRKTALQALFQVDVGKVPPERAINHVLTTFEIEKEAGDFAQELLHGTLEKLEEIDGLIRRLAVGWEPSRMANVDRNLLRLAIYEMRYREDVPNNVAINEAIELAKEFSGEEAAKFINGILGNLARELKESQ